MPNGISPPARSPHRVLVAGVSTRAAAESASRAGFDVTSLDAFGDLDHRPGVRTLSLRRDFGVPFTAAAAARASRELECDAVAYLSSFENHPAAVRALAVGRVLLGNPPAVLRNVRDPVRLAVALDGSGRAEAPAAAGPSRWLLKPRASGGGHRIRWWQPGEPVPRGYYVQQYIDGTPGSIIFAAANGRAVPLGLSRQLVGDPAFGASDLRYCGNILAPAGDPHFERDAELARAAAALASLVAATFSLVGVNGIDFVARDGVPHAVEVNPRYSASMELAERAYGISMFGIHAAACTTGELAAFDLARARSGHRAVGKAIVFARHDVICGDTRRWLQDSSVRDVPHPDEAIRAGRPVCTVFAEGPSSAACYTALVARAERVYATLESWAGVPA